MKLCEPKNKSWLGVFIMKRSICHRPSIELPYQKPMFCTYHNLSNVGIPAKNNPTSDIWYYNNSINLQCGTGLFNGNLFSPNLTFTNAWNLHCLERVSIRTEIIRNCIGEIVQSMLEKNYYVAFWGADDYFIKGKGGYKQNHQGHDGIICGADNVNSEYSMAAYDEAGVFNLFKTPQRGFIKALSYNYDHAGWGEITGFRCNQNQVALNILAIKAELSNYLNAAPPQTDQTVYGISVIPHVSNYFELMKKGDVKIFSCDSRLLKLLLEHKQCMHGRIKAIESELKMTNELSDEYYQISNLVANAWCMFLKMRMTSNLKYIDTIQTKLKELYEREYKFLNDFIKIL